MPTNGFILFPSGRSRPRWILPVFNRPHETSIQFPGCLALPRVQPGCHDRAAHPRRRRSRGASQLDCHDGGPIRKFLDQWIAAQTNLHTWSADVVETRALKTLSQPLVSTGKVWVAMPNQFRWELGQPAQTIALRQPDQLFIIYPRLKRVEKYPLTGNQTGPWRDALALLDASFPRNRADLDSRFQLLSVIQTNAIIQVRLQPRSQAARKFMSEISVACPHQRFFARLDRTEIQRWLQSCATILPTGSSTLRSMRACLKPISIRISPWWNRSGNESPGRHAGKRRCALCRTARSSVSLTG